MAIFGNFKGTTQSEFRIGKGTGNKIITGTVSDPATYEAGDVFVDSSNTSIQIFNGNVWQSVGNTLTDLNVDSGTLVVNSASDTVSIGSTSSNEKLFVNGNIRLGVNPAIKYSGAYLDLKHSNGTGTVIRVSDNDTGTDPIFRVQKANNSGDAIKVQGDQVTINNAFTLPSADGLTGQALLTAGNGSMYWGTVETDALNNIVEDTTPQLGGDLDLNNNDITGTGNVQLDGDILSTGNASIGGNLTVDGDLTLNEIQSGVVRGVIFEPITDYGFVADSANITIDYGAVNEPGVNGDFEYLNDTFGPTADSFTVNSLPSAAQPGQMIYVEDASGGSVMAFSDGSNWRRITDRAVIS